MEIGSHHSYLGMQITLCEGYLTVEMIHFIQKMLADVPNLKQFTTPATKEILSVTDEAMELPEHERKWFHTLVAKILFLFLLRFLAKMKDCILTLRPKHLKLEAYIDASFASHSDSKSHTGVAIFLGLTTSG